MTAFALEQCHDLLDNHVAGIHFYTLNKARSTTAVVQNLAALRP